MTGAPRLRTAALPLVALCLGLGGASASAQQAGSRQTREFVQAAESADQFEILEAQTVLGQTTNSEVRAFATRMLQDHRQHGQAVLEAASRSGMKPPETAMSADQAQMLGALQSVSGAAFDKLYLRQQVLAHRSALAFDQIYATSGDDAGLRQLASSAIPLISSHGDMANRMDATLASE